MLWALETNFKKLSMTCTTSATRRTICRALGTHTESHVQYACDAFGVQDVLCNIVPCNESRVGAGGFWKIGYPASNPPRAKFKQGGGGVWGGGGFTGVFRRAGELSAGRAPRPPNPPPPPQRNTLCRAHPNTWACGPGVIRQFAPPLPTSMVGLHRLGDFRPWVPKTSGLWLSEAVMEFKIHHGVRIATRGLKRIKVGYGVQNASWGWQYTMG